MNELTMDRLKENLESLKMKNTLEILDNYLERAVAEKLNIVDVLDHIFAEEAKSKRRRAYEKQVQMSGFPIKKTPDDFDFSFQPSIDKRQIDELATMRFLENGENAVFLGPPGVGKTHLASALGLVAAKHRFSTCYINCHQLIEQLKKARFENHESRKAELEQLILALASPYQQELDIILTAPSFKNTFTAIGIISEIGFNF